MSKAAIENWGGSQEAIEHHYDVGTEFYRLWLDQTTTYSSALWEGPEDKSNLKVAQIRKVDYHIRHAGAVNADRVLDIGCGWGATLDRLVNQHGVREAVGLTLSNDQDRYVKSRQLPGVEVRLENWVDHRPSKPYDAIISIGAFEHFTRPDHSREEKIAVYRNFFIKCRDWLARGGGLSLQTIAYGAMDPKDASLFFQTEVFPNSELPRGDEILQAADGILELVSLRNDRMDYARTCDAWLKSLRDRRAEALQLVGEEIYRRYEKYLKMCVIGFHMGKAQLLRIAFRPIRAAWGASSQREIQKTDCEA